MCKKYKKVFLFLLIMKICESFLFGKILQKFNLKNVPKNLKFVLILSTISK